MKGTTAQKIAKAKHWIKTYEVRIADGDSLHKRKDKKRWRLRRIMLRDKIEHWERMIEVWKRDRELIFKFDQVFKYAQTYFGKPNLDFKNLKWANSINKTIFCKYIVEAGYSDKTAAERLGVHIVTLSARRRMYNPKTMGEDYRKMKTYLDERINKELQIRNDRKSKIEPGS